MYCLRSKHYENLKSSYKQQSVANQKLFNYLKPPRKQIGLNLIEKRFHTHIYINLYPNKINTVFYMLFDHFFISHSCYSR